MVGKERHNRAVHEAGHAVIARKLGLLVSGVDARLDFPNVTHPSAGYAAGGLNDVAAQISEYEKDAIVALAGLEANRREYPDVPVLDIITEPMADFQNARDAIYRIICWMSGQPVPQGSVEMRADDDLQKKMNDVYFRLLRETAALIEKHWPTVERVAKHLERHGRIDDQALLDDLIERAERYAVR